MANLTDNTGADVILFLKRTLGKPITRDKALKIWQSMSEKQKVLIYDCYTHVRYTKLQEAIK